MRLTDFFASYMRAYKFTRQLLKDSIKFNKHQTDFSHICFNWRPLAFFLKCLSKVPKSSSILMFFGTLFSRGLRTVKETRFCFAKAYFYRAEAYIYKAEAHIYMTEAHIYMAEAHIYIAEVLGCRAGCTSLVWTNLVFWTCLVMEISSQDNTSVIRSRIKTFKWTWNKIYPLDILENSISMRIHLIIIEELNKKENSVKNYM